jgi:hypothetical protein
MFIIWIEFKNSFLSPSDFNYHIIGLVNIEKMVFGRLEWYLRNIFWVITFFNIIKISFILKQKLCHSRHFLLRVWFFNSLNKRIPFRNRIIFFFKRRKYKVINNFFGQFIGFLFKNSNKHM